MLRLHANHYELRPAPEVLAERAGLDAATDDEPETRISRRRGVGRAVPHFSRACLLRLIDYPEMPFRIAARDVVKAGPTALVVRTELPIAGQMISVAYKRLRLGGWINGWTAAVRPSRALKTWRMGRLFRERNIPTARPLAVILSRHRRGRVAYLATEWIRDAVQLDVYHQELEELDFEEQRCRTRLAATCLGETLGRMHAAGFSHPDLKSANVLLADDGKSMTAYVIDLDRIGLHRSVPRRVRLRNLSRLITAFDDVSTVSRSVRLRFLHAYLQAAGEPAAAWKHYWKQLDAAGISRRVRQQRNAS